MKRKPLSVTSVATAILFAGAAFAGEGSLDPSFGAGGKVRTHLGSTDYAQGIAFQADGKIVVVGTDGSNFLVFRYLPNGTLDPSFDLDGMVSTSFSSGSAIADAVAIQSDGKIVVVGSSGTDMAVARYTANGALDTTFDVDGKVTIDFGASDAARDVAIQSNGAIVIAGGSGGDFAIARLTPSGALDTTFDLDGKVLTDINLTDEATSLAIQSDGKIVAAGVADSQYPTGAGEVAVVRYNTNGALDTTFDVDGRVTTSFGAGTFSMAKDLAIQSDGKLLVAGFVATGKLQTADFALVRYRTDGSLDVTFDGDGRVSTSLTVDGDVANAINIQPDGRIVAAGIGGLNNITNFWSDDFAVARYLSNGALDPTFDGDGVQTSDLFGLSDVALAAGIQKDGKIVLAGQTVYQQDADVALARYLGSPTPFRNKNDFTQLAGLLTTVNFDNTSCGAPIPAASPGVLAGNRYADVGVNFSSGVIFDVVHPYGGSSPSMPNVISNTGVNTPTPALVNGTFDNLVTAVGITNTGAEAELRLYDAADNLVASLRSDTNAAAPDFIGFVAPAGVKRFEFDFASGIGFEGDDLVFSTLAVPDCQPPVIICPGDIVVGTSSSTGTVVNYQVLAYDDVAVASLNISPPSGTNFPVGQTKVTATATDPSGKTATCTFTVTVLQIGPVIQQLMDEIEAARLAPEITKSLRMYLQGALQAEDENNAEGACKFMNAFVEQVKGYAGEWIPSKLADRLLEEGARIQELIGCSSRGKES